MPAESSPPTGSVAQAFAQAVTRAAGRATVPLLALALAALALWRAACIVAGPDMDTDSYAHHMIARAILADPRDLAVHWVWLPLFHYLQVPLVWAGGTMNTVRWTNLALAAATPWVLFRYVRRTTRPGRADAPSMTAFIAALVAGACPIVMQMGTTAQTESLFALVMIGVAIAFQEGRYWTSAALLGAGVMLRYEAWASFLVIAPWILVEQAGALLARRAADGERESARGVGGVHVNASALAIIAVPVALIAIWAVLRRPVDGRWFGFLGQTRQFANDATHEQSALDRGLLGLAVSALYYPVIVPVRVLGPVMALVPFGIARTVRDQGLRFVAVLSACLGFISFSWITRSSLGLDRHFVEIVPLYATFAAQGAAVVADGLSRLLGRSPAQWVAGTITAALLGGLALELDLWMRNWRGSIEFGFPDRAALGAYLRSVPSRSTIFCDDATLEILSGLDRRRFDRHWLDDPHTWDLVARAAEAGERPYVATWSRKLVGHDSLGPVVFRAGQEPDDAATGVAVMRIDGDATRAGR